MRPERWSKKPDRISVGTVWPRTWFVGAHGDSPNYPIESSKKFHNDS